MAALDDLVDAGGSEINRDLRAAQYDVGQLVELPHLQASNQRVGGKMAAGAEGAET
jgi:hypothetical protein